MKTILYNTDNLKNSEINNTIKRAKALIINSKNEFILAYSHNNYFFLGGHVDDYESDYECLRRETKEEAGIDIEFEEKQPFFSITYMCKDYPDKGKNTKYINNYYLYFMDIVPNNLKTSLTEEEKIGNFHLKKINSEDVLKVLNDSLKECSSINVVQDTINVIEEYFKK